MELPAKGVKEWSCRRRGQLCKELRKMLLTEDRKEAEVTGVGAGWLRGWKRKQNRLQTVVSHVDATAMGSHWKIWAGEYTLF